MKRSRIVLIVTALVLSAILLTSCTGGKTAVMENVSEVLNVGYDLSSKPYATGSEITALEGAVSVPVAESDEFVVFEMYDDEDFTEIRYKVLSLRDNSIKLEFTADETTSFSFNAISGAPVLLVTKTVISESDEFEFDIDVNDFYYLYDVAGQLVDSWETEPEINWIADLFVCDDVAYKIEESTGKLVKEIEIPEYMNIEILFDYNDTYFYGVSMNDVVYVYDRSFKRVSSWSVPSFGDDSISDLNFYILNNGDMLVQYYVTLDEDATKYDLSIVEDGETIKANLVSNLILAATGESKELKLDYVIDDVTTNYDLYDKDEAAEKNYFVNTFENIVTVRPIVDGKILSSAADEDILFMDNEAELGSSLKMVANQAAELPTKIANDLYSVTMLDGGVTLIKADGTVVNSMNTALPVVGSYFVGTKAIYNLELNKVYDLTEKDVELIGTLGDTILIKVGDDEKYKITALCDGQEKEIYSHTKKSTSEFKLIGDGVYYIMDDNGNYAYYNEDGTRILSTTTELSLICESYEHDKMVVVSNPQSFDEEPIYIVFSK